MSRIQLLVGTENGLFIYRSDTTRQEWQMEGPLFAGWSVDSVFGDSRHGQRIFAGVSKMDAAPAIQISGDGGRRWKPVDPAPCYAKESGLTLRRFWQFTPGAPSQPDIYYAGVDEAGLFVSRDRGHTWHEVLGLNRHPARSTWRSSRGGLPLHTVCIDPDDPQRMWIAISAGGIYRSTDGGQSWRDANRGLRPVTVDRADGFLAHKLVLDPHDANVLYLQDFAGVYRSEDGAESWQPFEEGLPSTFGFPLCLTSNRTLYAAPLDMRTRHFIDGQVRVYRRRPQDPVWQPLANGFPTEPQAGGVLRNAMTVDSLTPAGVYLGTTLGQLFYSADEGEHWERLPGELSRVNALHAWVNEGN